MRYYIIAGEASGDLHGANLINSLLKLDANAEIRFWGGPLMQEASGKAPVKNYKDLAFMGFVEVVSNLSTILKNLKFCKEDILRYSPDVIVLIDYPGFNLRIAQFAKNSGFEVAYYISPQIWAWKESRIHKIKRYVDHMLVILPFEKEFYAKHGMDVHFVGHPLLDQLQKIPKVSREDFTKGNHLSTQPIVALLPGSRAQELQKMLSVMVSVAAEFPEYQFVIAAAPGLDQEIYRPFLNSQVRLVTNQTYELLQHSAAALVASGTATLETALLKVPQVVCYRGNSISYLIAKRLVRHIKYISLVNLIMDREIVKELIQEEFTRENLAYELQKLLDLKYRDELALQYNILENKLGGAGASDQAAEIIYRATETII